MKWLFAVVALAIVGLGSWYLVANRKPVDAGPSSRSEANRSLLRKGTVVHLTLLQPLHSGQAKVGDKVLFVVSEPVRAAGGEEMIPVGTCALATVTQSRAAGTLSQLLRQPARLAIRFDGIITSAGERIELAANGETNEYAFTRDNTGPVVSEATLSALLEHPETQRALSKLAQSAERGDLGDLDSDRESAATIAQAARRLGLTRIAKSAEEAKLSEVGALLDKLKSSPGNAVVSSGASLLAVVELAALASGTDDWLRGRLKGPNIRAHPGTVVEATVRQDTRISARAEDARWAVSSRSTACHPTSSFRCEKSASASPASWPSMALASICVVASATGSWAKTGLERARLARSWRVSYHRIPAKSRWMDVRSTLAHRSMPSLPESASFIKNSRFARI